MELSKKEQELFELIKTEGEVTIKMIKEKLTPNHTGALGKLLRYEKVVVSSNYNLRDENNKVIKSYIVKKEEEKE